ncbi:hypothetical protein BKA70DRAFT_252961 [Coprinopsis sp. MPI-PUGE-AT-0042]|nr:hypothetical protein BKA70DRAFT_252961 [Coprinopsis sp. MPI-PUGE-AT-0042]
MSSVESNTNHVLVRVFVILQLLGCFAFAFMVFSALVFPSVKRHPIWYNFCASWIIFSLSYSLLSFAGQQQTQRTHNVCVAQAAMVYAAPFIAGAASLSLVALLLMNILSALSGVLKKRYPIALAVAIAGPWILWIGVLTGAIVFIVRDQSVVDMSANGTFCVVTRSPIPRFTAIATAFFSVTILSLETLIIYHLYRNRGVTTVWRQSSGIAVRLLVFTVVVLTSGIIGLVFASTEERGVAFDVLIAIGG